MKMDFKLSGLPNYLVMLGVSLIFVGLVAMFIQVFVGFMTFLFGLLLATARYRLAIDLEEKRYHDYIHLLGYKHGEVGRFNNIEYIFIKKNRVNQTMSSRVASTTIRKDQFDAYLRFAENHKLHLATSDNYDPLVLKLRPMAGTLNVPLSIIAMANLGSCNRRCLFFVSQTLLT